MDYLDALSRLEALEARADRLSRLLGEDPQGGRRPGAEALSRPGAEARSRPGADALSRPGAEALNCPGAELSRHGFDRDAVPWGRFALALRLDDLEFLIDPKLLRMPPRVLVRRAGRSMEVWLDEEDVSVATPGDFTRFEVRRVLALVRENLEELSSCWFDLREDDRRGRIGRNVFVD